MFARGFYYVSTTISKYNEGVVRHAGGAFGPADSVRFAKPAGPPMACLHCVGLRAAAGAVGLPVRRLADADRFRSAEIRCLVASMRVFPPRGRRPYANTRISAERRVPDLRAAYFS